ncbi:MAG: ribonuclease H-like domain-containing protein [Nitrososphaerota archaeon]|nr:ribonuclease H-like domain-containing protein [Nitrososphaerota archaeon]
MSAEILGAMGLLDPVRSGEGKSRICIIDVESTALDADVGIFVGGGLMELDGKFSWFYSRNPREEPRALGNFLEKISGYQVVFTWNGRIFDLPFITARSIKHGLRVERLHTIIHIDLAEFVKNNLKLARNDLYHVAKFLNIKKNLNIEGLDIPKLYMRAVKGDKEASLAIKRHCRDDLEVTRKVLKKLFPLVRVRHQGLRI